MVPKTPEIAGKDFCKPEQCRRNSGGAWVHALPGKIREKPGDLARLPPFSPSSPAVTCKTIKKTQQGVDPFLDLFSVYLPPLGFLLFLSSSRVQRRRCWLLSGWLKIAEEAVVAAGGGLAAVRLKGKVCWLRGEGELGLGL
ncbi:hypothetical protein Peur_021511 [Populus x canadensis]